MICPFCKEEIMEGAIKCKHCGSMLYRTDAHENKIEPNLLIPAQTNKLISRVGRVLSGLCGIIVILSIINGFTYFIESKLIGELVVDIVSSVLALAFLLMAFVPEWISKKLGVRIENGGVFAFVLILLIIVYFMVTTLGPEPPGGWWAFNK